MPKRGADASLCRSCVSRGVATRVPPGQTLCARCLAERQASTAPDAVRGRAAQRQALIDRITGTVLGGLGTGLFIVLFMGCWQERRYQSVTGRFMPHYYYVVYPLAGAIIAAAITWLWQRFQAPSTRQTSESWRDPSRPFYFDIVERAGALWHWYPWIGLVVALPLFFVDLSDASDAVQLLLRSAGTIWGFTYTVWVVFDVLYVGARWQWILYSILCYPLGFIAYLLWGRQ